MPSRNIDANVNGRESRASNVSGVRQQQEHLNSTTSANTNSNMNSTAPGVLSMLKTTTESGDIGTLALNQAWHPKIHHGPPRRPNGPTPSRTSSHYSRTASIRSKASGTSLQDYNTRADVWPYINHPFANSPEFHCSNPEIRSLPGPENFAPLPQGLLERPDVDWRTQSLTQNSYKSRHLSSHRSVSSLRSQGPPPSSRTPKNYPARLRRPPIHRPSSPALSDSIAASARRANTVRVGQDLRSHTSTPTQFAQTGQFQPLRSLNGYNFPSPPRASPNQTLNSITNIPTSGLRAATNVMPHDCLPPSQRMLPLPFPQVYNPTLPRPLQPFKQCPSPLSVEQTSTIMSGPQPQRRTDSTPYAGFVQRVKDILEEKATPEKSVRIPRYDSPTYIYDLPRHISELPGSPVKNRLTREMIKAAVGPSSDEGIMSSPDAIHSVLFSQHGADHSDEASATDALALSKSINQAKSTLERFDQHKNPDSDAAASPSPSGGATDQKFGGNNRNSLFPAAYELQLEPSEVSSTGQDVADIPSPSAWISPCLSMIPERSSERPSSSLEVFDDERARRTESTEKSTVDSQPSLVNTHTSKLEEAKSAPPMSNSRDNASDQNASLHDSGVATAVTSEGFDPLAQTTSQVHSDDEILSTEFEVAKVVRIPRTPHQSVDFQVVEPAKGSHSVIAENHVFDRHEDDVQPAMVRSASNNTSHRRSMRNSFAIEGGENVSTAYQSGGSTTDIRMSMMKQFHFPLSDLTEDSQEDASTTNLRILGAKAPVVLRGAGTRNAKSESKAVQRSLRQSSEPPRSYLSRQISHTKGIPSFHFSRNDLTAKLNVALGIRNSISLENLSSKKKRNRFSKAIERSESSSFLHDRYRSFFSEFEDTEAEAESGDRAASTDASEVVEPVDRALRRQEIISEIERLSIPSVNGLTLRLSEFFPLLNDLNEATKSEDGEATAVEHSSTQCSRDLELAHTTLESVISAGAAARNKRRSGPAGACDANKEACAVECGPLRLMKDLPPLPKDDGADKPARKGSVVSKEKLEALSELEATVPIEMDTKSAEKPAELQAARSSDDASDQDAPKASDSCSQGARRRNHGHGHSRSEGAANVDGNIPRQARHASGSPAPRSRLNRMRASKSVDTMDAEDELRIARSMSPGVSGEANLVPRSNNVSTDVERPETLKKGLIGSLQRKIGLKPRIDRSGFAIDPAFLHPEERATEPGDRYPTSGLTPPAGLNIEVENRSYFSDDSSDASGQARASQTLKKRLTRLRSKRPSSRPLSPRQSHAGSNPKNSWTAPVVNGGSVFDDSSPEARPSNGNGVYVVEQEEGEEEDDEDGQQQQPAVGMSKVEFRAKLVMHRLRKLWYKSGFLLRSMSRSNKKQQRQQPMLSGSSW